MHPEATCLARTPGEAEKVSVWHCQLQLSGGSELPPIMAHKIRDSLTIDWGSDARQTNLINVQYHSPKERHHWHRKKSGCWVIPYRLVTPWSFYTLRSKFKHQEILWLKGPHGLPNIFLSPLVSEPLHSCGESCAQLIGHISHPATQVRWLAREIKAEVIGWGLSGSSVKVPLCSFLLFFLPRTQKQWLELQYHLRII